MAEAEERRVAKLLLQRLTALGMEAHLVPGGRCVRARLRLRGGPFPLLDGPRDFRELVFATVGATRPWSYRTAARLVPSTCSITRKWRPSASPESYARMIPGWDRAASALASRRKRATASGSLTLPGGSTLMATRRSRSASRARYTAPMPPSPSFCKIS